LKRSTSFACLFWRSMFCVSILKLKVVVFHIFLHISYSFSTFLYIHPSIFPLNLSIFVISYFFQLLFCLIT
jgi:hypothetical protein